MSAAFPFASPVASRDETRVTPAVSLVCRISSVAGVFNFARVA